MWWFVNNQQGLENRLSLYCFKFKLLMMLRFQIIQPFIGTFKKIYLKQLKQ